MILNLKQIRTRQGLTLDQLAEMAGLSKSFLSQLETGSRQPSTETIETLAQTLSVPESELIAQQGFGEGGPTDTLARRVLAALDNKTSVMEQDFKVGTDGKMVQIIATVDRDGIDRLIKKLEAMKALLDA